MNGTPSPPPTILKTIIISVISSLIAAGITALGAVFFTSLGDILKATEQVVEIQQKQAVITKKVNHLDQVLGSLSKSLENISHNKLPRIIEKRTKTDQELSLLHNRVPIVVGNSYSGDTVEVATGKTRTTGISIKFKPRRNKSKILLFLTGRVGIDGASGNSATWYDIIRNLNGNKRKVGSYDYELRTCPNNIFRTTSIVCLDAPNTTEEVEYTVVIRHTNSGTAKFWYGRLIAIEL